jgi:predicted permease
MLDLFELLKGLIDFLGKPPDEKKAEISRLIGLVIWMVIWAIGMALVRLVRTTDSAGWILAGAAGGAIGGVIGGRVAGERTAERATSLAILGVILGAIGGGLVYVILFL